MRSSLSVFVRRSISSAAKRTLSPVGVIVGGVLLWLFMCGLCAWVLYESRNDAYTRAEQNARNLMLVIERDIARNVELYDLSPQAVVDGMADPKVMALPPKLRSEVLFDRAASGRYLGSIFVINERGDIILDSRFIPARVGNFADRDYFTVHRDSSNSIRALSSTEGRSTLRRHHVQLSRCTMAHGIAAKASFGSLIGEPEYSNIR